MAHHGRGVTAAECPQLQQEAPTDADASCSPYASWGPSMEQSHSTDGGSPRLIETSLEMSSQTCLEVVSWVILSPVKLTIRVNQNT